MYFFLYCIRCYFRQIWSYPFLQTCVRISLSDMKYFSSHDTWHDSILMRYKFKYKYTWLLWQFCDLRVQPGTHCGRTMWQHKSLKFFSKLSESRKILFRKVGKSQNTMKPFFLNFSWIDNVFYQSHQQCW